jgi:hypothetical protein
MRTRFLRLVPFAFCLVSSRSLLAQVSAQTASAASETTHAPDPDSGMTGHVNGLFIPLVTGQAFHAKITVEINRLLPDGTTVAQKYYTLAARDSTGREYRETRDLVPADSDLEPALVRTIVYNPKTSIITTCTPDQRICRQMTFDPTQHPVEEPAGPSPDGKSVLTRESLGTKTIDGLQATGTRETLTFNPGTPLSCSSTSPSPATIRVTARRNSKSLTSSSAILASLGLSSRMAIGSSRAAACQDAQCTRPSCSLSSRRMSPE